MTNHTLTPPGINMLQKPSLTSLTGTDKWLLFQILLALAGLATWLRSTWSVIHRYAEKTCLSTVHIKDDDPLYHDVLQWMNDFVFEQRNFRSVLATTRGDGRGGMKAKMGVIPGPPPPDAGEKGKDKDGNGNGNEQPIKFKPFNGSRIFTFQSRWIFFTHASPASVTRQSMAGGFFGGSAPGNGLEDTNHIKLQTLSLSLSFSPSLQYLRHFLNETRTYSTQLKKQNTSISIYRAISNVREMVRWSRVTTRPARSMTTVILDSQKKNSVLSDLEEYLHPATRHWYADHGIPYRRGYLLSGPPGTGKTSLSSAIAGAFGLDVYVLSLLDANVTEAQFLRLFSEVPEKSLVLLEDVDAAGMVLRRAVPNSHEKDHSHPQGPRARAVDTPGGVSLSGLLNAIDGVSSQEGRVLVMTTNAPDTLDPALIRPGRVDLHVRFEMPGKCEFEELFCSMFSDAPGMVHHEQENEERNENEKAGDGKGEKEKKEKKAELDINALATSFAAQLPEQKLSLAEVQGYLLQHKRNPREACARAAEWIEQTGDGMTNTC